MEAIETLKTMKKVLFIDTAHPVLCEELVAMGFECDSPEGLSYDDYMKIISDYEGVVVRSKVPLDAPLLKMATSLRFIARVGAGMENIDIKQAVQQGIVCLNAPEGNRNAVAEHALGMLLALMNNLLRADAQVRKGVWIRAENRGYEIQGKTVGIIGFGNTGSAFAKKLQGFGAVVLAYDKYKTNFSDDSVVECAMQRIFEEADILSLHLPLTDETESLVDNDFLQRFRKPIWLVNTARGPIVKTADLVHHLQNGKVRGACLDVLEYEKFSFEALRQNELPESFAKLLNMSNVMLSPHIAGWTHESHYLMAKVLADKIRRLFA